MLWQIHFSLEQPRETHANEKTQALPKTSTGRYFYSPSFLPLCASRHHSSSYPSITPEPKYFLVKCIASDVKPLDFPTMDTSYLANQSIRRIPSCPRDLPTWHKHKMVLATSEPRHFMLLRILPVVVTPEKKRAKTRVQSTRKNSSG